MNKRYLVSVFILLIGFLMGVSIDRCYLGAYHCSSDQRKQSGGVPKSKDADANKDKPEIYDSFFDGFFED